MPQVVCPIDGTRFSIPPSRLEKLKHAPTCSPECKRLAMTGKNHWNYTGGAYVDVEGYRRVRTGVGTYELEQRVVMERKLKRPLRDDEIVKHRDGDRLNNKPGNLYVVIRRAVKKAKRRAASAPPRRARKAAAARPRPSRRRTAR